MQDLVVVLGSVERPAVVKSLATWVELGVLKESSPSVFKLLNVAEATEGSSRATQKQPGTYSGASCGGDLTDASSRCCGGRIADRYSAATASGTDEGVLEGEIYTSIS